MDKQLQILIVEDERIVAEDISQHLMNMGYVITGLVASGREALEHAEKQKPDLVLMDIVLKEKMNGIETAAQIRSRFDIPVVYLTAHVDKDTLNRAMMTEPFGYILKPLNEKELETGIHMAVYKHRMEKKLRERENWFSTTLRSIGDGVIATDKEGRVTFINRIGEELTGWTQKEAEGKPLEKVFQTSRRDPDMQIDQSIEFILHDHFVSGFFDLAILVSRDKRTTPIEEKFSPIKSDRGDILGTVVVFRDITSRLAAEQASHFAEEALRDSEERYRSLFEDSRDAIYITSRKGRFVIANQSTLDLFHVDKNEMVRMNIRNLFKNVEDWKQFQKDIEDKGSVRDYDVRLKNKQGEELNCLVTSSVRRTKNNKILGYQGIIRDITERKRAEEEKEKIQAQLLQAQKMEAVGILAGGIAHDFNNILTVIQGNTDLSLLRLDESDPVCRDLKEVQLAAVRAADLTSQLLLFSRKKPMRFVPEDVNIIIEGLLKMLHRLIGEDISIRTDLKSDLWNVKADRGTMEQVIMNVAINARDAMPEGGILTMKSENVVLSESDSKQMHETRPGKFVRLTMADTGLGMEETTRTRIFEPFFSTKSSGKGTGLGLSVVYGIVKHHGGWIYVTSEPRQGSNFEIFLPVCTMSSEEMSESSVPLKSLKGDGSRILVVEDEKGVNQFTRTALSENGYDVYAAESVREAVQLFKEEEKNFQLLLSDVVLADRTGLDLVDELKVMKPGLKVLLCSGYTGKKSQWAAIQKRGIRFMQKPYSVVDLLLNVKETLEGRRA